MNQKPLVSIICLCYNQSAYVKEAIVSVWKQSYKDIQLIVVDDCSEDDSVERIKKLLKDKDIPFISLNTNIGSTSAFNRGLQMAKGQYVIDLAADDILDNDRVRKQVELFESLSDNVGVVYSDAIYISENGREISKHFSNEKLTPHSGDIYLELIEKYFIPTPTMMIRKTVLDDLSGYDEVLAYEDFDFWIRSSRKWDYAYHNEVLTLIRKVRGSFSTKVYAKHSEQLYSTYLVCKKIQILNNNEEENVALIRRLKYEIRHASITGNHKDADLFFNLLNEMNGGSLATDALMLWNKLKIDMSSIRKFYHKIRY